MISANFKNVFVFAFLCVAASWSTGVLAGKVKVQPCGSLTYGPSSKGKQVCDNKNKGCGTVKITCNCTAPCKKNPLWGNKVPSYATPKELGLQCNKQSGDKLGFCGLGIDEAGMEDTMREYCEKWCTN